MSEHAKTEDKVLLVILEGIPLVLSKNNINTHNLDKYRAQLIHTISH